MAAAAQRPELVAIVGPTASGKSELAMKIARKFNGEIICADSRTVYKGMNIGTAKPSASEQREVRHWALDLIEPGEAYSAARFKKYAEAAIKDIKNRGKLTILVGGTGLYIDSVLFDFGFLEPGSMRHREELEKLSVEELQGIIKEKGYKMPENARNTRHLVLAIERKGQSGTRKHGIAKGVLLLGLLPSDKTLKRRIDRRAEQIFERGIVAETQSLLAKYGEKALLSTAGISYQMTLKYIRGEVSREEVIVLIKTREWQYARRQKTWFKSNAHINWFIGVEEAYEAIKNRLANT